jgi:hypothetical protein
MSIPLLRRLLMKEAVKDTAGSSGIMSINKNIAAKVEQQLQRYVNDAMQQGVDLDTLSPEQLKMIVQMNKPKPPRVIAGDSPEGRGITEALLGKRGEVVDFPQKRSFKQEVDDMIKDGTITKGARGMKKSKKVQDREMFQDANKRLKTEAQLKAEMEASNKKAVKNLGNKRQLTEDEYQDFLDEVGGADQLEAYDFDGTVGSANKIKKQQADYMAEMQMEYRKGKLDPEPGSRTPQRKRFLQSKLDEAEASGDARLLSREEREELFDLDDIEDFAGGGRAGFKGGGLTPEDYLKVKDMLNHWHDYKKGGGTLSKTKFANAFFRENNADGGVAGLLGERPGYQDGNTVLDKALALGSVPYNFAKGVIGNVSNPGAVTQVSLTQAQKNRLNEIAQAKGTPTGTIDYSDYGSPTKTFSGISNMTPLDASLATTMGGTGFSINPDGSVNYTGGAYDFNKGNVITDFIDKGGIIGAADKLGGKIYNTVNPPEEDDEYDFSGIEGQTAFLPELFMLGKSVIGPAIALGKSGLSKKAIAEALIKDRLRKEAGKKFKKIITPPKYPQGSTIKTKGPTTTTRPGGDRGRNIVSGRSGDRDFSSKGPDTSSNPRGRSNRASQERGYALHGADGGLANFADGGPARQNFKMGKRAFLKAMLGTGAGIAGLKSGLFGMGGKEATKKAVKEVAKQSAGSGTPPPYFFKLVEKIKTMGDDTLATQDKAIAKKYKDYTMEEDFAGNIEIIKKGDDVAEDVYMSYKVDEVPVKGKKGSAKVEEYEEFTARPDAEGKMKDIEPGVPDEVVNEGSVFEDNLTEFGMTKKASGGIARMLGE